MRELLLSPAKRPGSLITAIPQEYLFIGISLKVSIHSLNIQNVNAGRQRVSAFTWRTAGGTF